jgi:hypothetical protein
MVFRQIHEIVFHGKGGYDWNTVYNMPIWLRKFTFERLKEFYTSEEDDDKLGQSLEAAKETQKVQIPAYVTKAAGKRQ